MSKAKVPMNRAHAEVRERVLRARVEAANRRSAGTMATWWALWPKPHYTLKQPHELSPRGRQPPV